MPNSSREKYVRAAPLEVEALAIQKKSTEPGHFTGVREDK